MQRGRSIEEGCSLPEPFACRLVGPGLRIQLRGQMYFLHSLAAAAVGI